MSKEKYAVMKTVVVYAGSQRCCEKSAAMLVSGLGGDATLVSLDEETRLDLSPYDTVIIGGPVYFGRLDGRVRRFCRQHQEVLLLKRLGLYVCCVESGELTDEEVHELFPPDLHAHAEVVSFFGGEMALERLNFVQRFMVRSIAKVDHNISALSEERIGHFLGQLQGG